MLDWEIALVSMVLIAHLAFFSCLSNRFEGFCLWVESFVN